MRKTPLNSYVVSCRCRGLVWGLLIILTIVLAPAISVAQQPAPSPSLAPGELIASKIKDIVGIWKTQHKGAVAYMRYDADGTSKLAESLDDLSKGIIIVPGTVWFEGDVLHVKDSYGQGTYRVRVRKEGNTPARLTFIKIDDPNTYRSQDMAAGMTWVAPSP